MFGLKHTNRKNIEDETGGYLEIVIPAKHTEDAQNKIVILQGPQSVVEKYATKISTDYMAPPY